MMIPKDLEESRIRRLLWMVCGKSHIPKMGGSHFGRSVKWSTGGLENMGLLTPTELSHKQ